MAENEEQKTEDELSDIELAELANKKLREKDVEIAKLKKDLAKEKLLSSGEEEEKPTLTREECIKRISGSNTCNYDYAEAVVALTEIELAEGNPNPLGQDGEDVYKFFKDVIEACDGDKSRFTSIYQASLEADPKEIAMAFKKRNQRK